MCTHWCAMRMKMKQMKKDNTFRNLIFGIVGLGILIQIVLFIVADDILYQASGLWMGIFISCACAFHMKRSIEDALDLGEDGAIKHTRIAYATRMVIAAIVIVIFLVKNLGNPLTLLIGLFPLKISAYLQPVIAKLLDKQ